MLSIQAAEEIGEYCENGEIYFTERYEQVNLTDWKQTYKYMAKILLQ